ncbi:hypothetical protein JMJ77_0008892, partial [Colletotrichum scovillei]
MRVRRIIVSLSQTSVVEGLNQRLFSSFLIRSFDQVHPCEEAGPASSDFRRIRLHPAQAFQKHMCITLNTA